MRRACSTRALLLSVFGLRVQGLGFGVQGLGVRVYRGISHMRTPPPVGPYSSPMPGDLW